MNLRSFILPALAMTGIVLVSNILVQYPINAWLTWGEFSDPVAYLVTDVCNRTYGAPLARRVAWVGFATGLGLSRWLSPWRIAAASAPAFIVSQLLDVAIFNPCASQLFHCRTVSPSAVARAEGTAQLLAPTAGATAHR